MNKILFGLTLFGLFDNSISLECGSNDIGIDWTAAAESVVSTFFGSLNWGWSWESTSQCPWDVCTASHYNITLRYDVNDPFWSNFVDEGVINFFVDGAYCGVPALCNTFAGGTDACRSVTYDFQLWFPETCNEAQDYHATILDYLIQYKYACCETETCNQNYDWNDGTCVEDNQVSGYVSDLFECWNGIRKDWMKYLKCDDEGLAIYDWEGGCKTKGKWEGLSGSVDADCQLILTCNSALETILTNFGECACKAAYDADYSSDFITELMETQWNAFCGNSQIQCTDTGDLNITLTYYVVTYDFYIDIDFTTVDENFLAKITLAVANAANVNDTLISITGYYDGGSVGRRRLQSDVSTKIKVSVKTESQEDADAVETSLNSDAQSNIDSETGQTSTSGTTEQSTESKNNISSYSAAFNAVPSFTLFVMLALFIQIII